MPLIVARLSQKPSLGLSIICIFRHRRKVVPCFFMVVGPSGCLPRGPHARMHCKPVHKSHSNWMALKFYKDRNKYKHQVKKNPSASTGHDDFIIMPQFFAVQNKQDSTSFGRNFDKKLVIMWFNLVFCLKVVVIKIKNNKQCKPNSRFDTDIIIVWHA